MLEALAHSFLKCGIFNKLDGSEGDLISMRRGGGCGMPAPEGGLAV